MNFYLKQIIEAKVVYVQPNRFASSEWKAGKKVTKDGDIRAAYSADKLVDNKMRKPFEFAGSLWTSVGSCGRSESSEGVRLVLYDHYEGKTYSYGEKRSYTGQCATYGNVKYVLTDRVTFKPVSAEDAVKQGKQGILF